MVQPFLDACSISKNDYQVAVLGLILSLRTVPNVSVYGPDHHFQDQWSNVERCYLTFLHPMVGVSRSVWWFKCGNCRFVLVPHAMLVLAELIVCSTRGFACILAKWFWPTVMSLLLTYGSPEASSNKRADTYFGRRSASLIKEFWALCTLAMTVSETIMVETIPYSNSGLTHCL